MKLVDFLLSVFGLRLHSKFSIDSFNTGTSFLEFIEEVKYFLNILRNLKSTYGPKVRVALIGANSTEYITCYIALLLSQIDFYLIPHKMKLNIVESIISNSNINFIFTGNSFSAKNVMDKLHNLPFVKGSYDIQTDLYYDLREAKLTSFKLTEYVKTIFLTEIEKL